jgi:hypothetical protein
MCGAGSERDVGYMAGVADRVITKSSQLTSPQFNRIRYLKCNYNPTQLNATSATWTYVCVSQSHRGCIAVPSGLLSQSHRGCIAVPSGLSSQSHRGLYRSPIGSLIGVCHRGCIGTAVFRFFGISASPPPSGGAIGWAVGPALACLFIGGG